jgi:rRNA maturation endonuclease Nob1
MRFKKGVPLTQEQKNAISAGWKKRRELKEKVKAEREVADKSLQSNILKEINMKQEFENMSEKINPKVQKEEEKAYECGACGKKFNDKMGYCPACGVQFE